MGTTGHILLGNHVVNHTKGPMPASVLGHGPDLHIGNLGHMAYGGCTLRTTHGGYILEFTYVGGPGPSLITSHGRDFYPGSQTTVAHGYLARGMAHGGHILLGNREIARASGTTPVTNSYPVMARSST